MIPFLIVLGFFVLAGLGWRIARYRRQAADSSSAGISSGTPDAGRTDWLPSDFTNDTHAHHHDSADSSGADAGSSGGDGGGSGGGD